MKFSFINYRKESNGNYPIKGWLPHFNKYWAGKIWHFEWRGFAISIDVRKNWLADMATYPSKKE